MNFFFENNFQRIVLLRKWTKSRWTLKVKIKEENIFLSTLKVMNGLSFFKTSEWGTKCSSTLQSLNVQSVFRLHFCISFLAFFCRMKPLSRLNKFLQDNTGTLSHHSHSLSHKHTCTHTNFHTRFFILLLLLFQSTEKHHYFTETTTTTIKMNESGKICL